MTTNQMTEIAAYYPLPPDDMRKMKDVQRRGAGSYPFNLRPERVMTLNQIKAEAVREAVGKCSRKNGIEHYITIDDLCKYADELEKGDG